MTQIKFTGKQTNNRITYTATADSYKELYEELSERGIIGKYYDNESAVYRELIEYVRPDLEEKIETLEDDELAIDELIGNAISSLKDEEYRQLIQADIGNAYYQEFEVIED